MATATEEHVRPATEIATLELALWLADPDPGRFPYDAVVAEYHRVGKHLVSRELLAALDSVRASLPARGDDAHPRLRRFLDTALDKFDGRYDNPSYLALEQLGLPGTADPADASRAGRERDRLLVLLMADMLRVELAAAAGRTEFLPEMRPGPRTVAKRCRHGIRVARPALERLGIDVDLDCDDPVEAAGRLCCAVLRGATAEERRRLQLTALPVSLVHDEYMFLRALQSYETVFAFVGVELAATVSALGRGDGAAAVRALASAEAALAESSALFSLAGTMQPEAFLAFREFTDGASAIQSRSYKRAEARCRRPDDTRLSSPAYDSVPELKQQVVAGLPNIDDAFGAACGSGALTGDQHAEVHAAMQRYAAALLKWRKTHHSIAVRMLGDRRGTGSTEGVGYLESVREIPVFTAGCPAGFGERATADQSCPHA